MPSSVAIDDAGHDKPWMIMVHGMSQDHRVFDKQVDAFVKRYRILLIDLPEHGLATSHEGPYCHVEYARYVEAAIRESSVSGAHYWATHTGTAAGLIIACRTQSLIASLILEGPVMPGQNVPVVTKSINQARKIAAEEGNAAAVDDWWETACWFDHMRTNYEDCRAEQHRAIIRDFSARPWTDQRPPAEVDDLTGPLSKLNVPTLIYNGQRDHPEFLAEAERLTKLLPLARQSTIANAGGFPAWENPIAVNAVVEEFLIDRDQ
jgi:3-oxoadipate enol-lactonase